MGKHFVINPNQEPVEKQELIAVTETKHKGIDIREVTKEQLASQVLLEDDNLKCVEGKVVIKINLQNKNYHTFENGQKIRLERQFNNLNIRETTPVNAIVIDAENIKKGAEILIHPNCIHDSNRIFSYKNKSPDIAYYSIKYEDCFVWNDNGEWKTLPPYDLALRVFKPYKGLMEGIEPTLITDTLYVCSGELLGQVVRTLKACDYQIVFQDSNGREGNLIRFRAFGDEKTNREPEAIAILNDLTEQVKKGELYIGLSISDCKPL